MNIKRLQKLAGIEEIKVNRPNINLFDIINNNINLISNKFNLEKTKISISGGDDDDDDEPVVVNDTNKTIEFIKEKDWETYKSFYSSKKEGDIILNNIKIKYILYEEIEEGAKVDFNDSSVSNIEIKYTYLNGEQLNTTDGNRKTTNYNVFYSLEANSNTENNKQAQDALKYNSDKINTEELKNLIVKTLGKNLKNIDYIGYLESKGNLNEKLTNVIKDIYNIPDENIIKIEKIAYEYIDDAVDWKDFYDESPSIKDAIISFLNKKSKEKGPYKIRKSGEIESKIIQRLHSKYNLGLNPNINNKNLPPIYDIFIKCITQNKKLLIIDDNVHTGEDFRKIFKSIDKLSKILWEKYNTITSEEQKALNRKKEIENLPHFKNDTLNDRLKTEYIEVKKTYDLVNKKQKAASIIFKDSKNNIFGYVLYILKNQDL